MRVVTAVGLAAAGVASVLVFGADQGYVAPAVRLHAGTAWLASTKPGQLTLLDGGSAEVAARVPVARPATPLLVAQQAATGYAVNRNDGSVVRVDGATLHVSSSVSPIPGADDQLTIFPTSQSLYALDGRRGLVATVDPTTLTPLGTPQPLTTGATADAAVTDGDGRLWVLDQHTGDLVWLSHGTRHLRHAAAAPETTRLTLTDNHPALLDPTRGQAELLDPDTGAVTASLHPDLKPGDTVAVSGSPNQPRLLISVGSRGLLMICTFGAGSCATPLLLGSPGAELGAPVEVNEHAVVPDYSTGRVWIIDLNTRQVVVERQLFDRPVRFELLVKDGIIFYNDPDSEHAGVLDLDGRVHAITKYDPTNPDRGITPIPDTGAKPGAPAVAGQPNPHAAGPQNPGAAAVGPVPGMPGPPTEAGLYPDGKAPPPDTIVSIVVQPHDYGRVGDEFTFTAVPRPPLGIADAHWAFGDGTDATGATVSHRWDRPGTFPVSAAITLTTGQTAPVAVTTIVIDPADAPPRIVRINAQPATPVVSQPVDLSADVDLAGRRVDKWAWTIDKTDGNTAEASADTPGFRYVFTTPGIYTATLAITSGTDTVQFSRQIAVTSGTVIAWGSNYFGQATVPPEAANGVTAIAAGGSHSLALKGDGSVIAWGDDTSGQTDVPPGAGSGVTAIAAGGSHSLALKADGSVIAWGLNNYGQATVPPQAASGVTAIAAGGFYSLVLKADGSVIAWGDNLWGLSDLPPGTASGVTAIAAGWGHSLVLKADGSVIAWGQNYYGSVTVPPEAASGVTAIAAGWLHSLALKADGSVIAWGNNDQGQSDVPPEAASGVRAIAAGLNHSLACF